jgi:hypothetical protein
MGKPRCPRDGIPQVIGGTVPACPQQSEPDTCSQRTMLPTVRGSDAKERMAQNCGVGPSTIQRAEVCVLNLYNLYPRGI